MKSGRRNRKRAKQQPLRPPTASVRLSYLALAFWGEFQPQNEEQEELDRKANRFWKKMQKFFGL
jgi:hypothetical protein